MVPIRFVHRHSSRRRGFTLVQLLFVLIIMSALAAVLMPAFHRSQATARRAQCDVKLKAIALALETYRQENHAYPTSLDDLVSKGYLTQADALHCPADSRPNGSYAEYYAIRADGDSQNLPIVVCPLHEEDTGQGGQARVGQFTTNFAVKPASLASGNNVTVHRPDSNSSVPGYAGMALHGGDRVQVGGFGTAAITFADGSTAQLGSGSDVTVLQSYVDGQYSGLLYTLVKELAGDVTYTIHHGSRFDVVTPVATAGARGTKFRVKVTGNAVDETSLYVYNGSVVFTGQGKSGLATLNTWIGVLNIGGLLHFLFP